VDELVGRPVDDFIYGENRKEHQRIMEVRVKGKKDTYERKIKRLDGEHRWVLISASPMFDSEKRFMGSVGMASDITKRKHTERNLRKAYQEITELKNQIEADNIYLREEIKLEHNFDQIIGNSDEIKYALYRLEQVANTNSTVLISGETGTGKELFVRAIHNAGSRADRPLIKVNCATLPEQFIESELFGHVKGAYTGADNLRQGRFEIAHRSTLFLDEIGELPPALQAKLLRVLQDGEFERLGDSHTIKTDVRLIAATNRDLEKMVKAGRFRQDLWYRLNVFPITIPPLRRRKDDIPLLVNHFVKKIGKRIGKEITKISKTVLNELTAYDWPGNVRELEHILERSIILSQGKSLQLFERLTGSKGQADRAGMQPLAAMERDHILRTLEQTKWVIEGPKGAAAILEIHPNTLRYRMQKLGIRRPKHR
jgi:transcriptional regulator with GAF, ATPase, and Fis domain